MKKQNIISIDSFNSAGEWFEYCRGLGFAVPVQAGHQISKCMEANRLSFPDAYRKCIKDELIIEHESINVVLVARVP